MMRIDEEVDEAEDTVVEVDEEEGGRLFCGGGDGGGGGCGGCGGGCGGCGEESGVDSRGTVDTVELLSGFGVDGVVDGVADGVAGFVVVSFVSEIEVVDVVDVVGGGVRGVGVRVVGDSVDIWSIRLQGEQTVFNCDGWSHNR